LREIDIDQAPAILQTQDILPDAAIRTIVDAKQERCAAWLCPQAFRYSGTKIADYPNFDEYNCMLWTAIANGAKGITPFIYCDHFNSVDLRMASPSKTDMLACRVFPALDSRQNRNCML